MGDMTQSRQGEASRNWARRVSGFLSGAEAEQGSGVEARQPASRPPGVRAPSLLPPPGLSRVPQKAWLGETHLPAPRSRHQCSSELHP